MTRPGAGFSARLLSLATLPDAEAELHRIGVDPAGIALMAGKMLTRCIHLPGLPCRQANILKQEMLSLGGDAAVARGTVACSIERTDVVLIGTEKQLHRLCDKLKPQPFGLPALGAEIRALLARAAQPAAYWQTSRRRLQLDRPLIMGILNVTPDSFSDGGRYATTDLAVEQALAMIDQGADIIDIGGESTRPGARPVPETEESGRVVPVIERLAATTGCPISIDTWKSGVARAALAAGAEIVNDISGLGFDPGMAATVANATAGVVLMHTRGTPDAMQADTHYHDLMGELTHYLQQSLATARSAGIADAQIALDPGIGFAKSADGNLEILRRLTELSGFGLPLLIGASRKSFIGSILERPTDDRLLGTAAVVALAVANGAGILRVHDVAAMCDAALMAHAITYRRTQL